MLSMINPSPLYIRLKLLSPYNNLLLGKKLIFLNVVYLPQGQSEKNENVTQRR